METGPVCYTLIMGDINTEVRENFDGETVTRDHAVSSRNGRGQTLADILKIIPCEL